MGMKPESSYDPRVLKMDTPEACERFIINVRDTHPELVPQARRRAVELKAQQLGGKSQVECEALEAVVAYEAILAERHGRKVSASRTHQMIRRHGILGAIERAVNRPDDLSGYQQLVRLGMSELSFEAIVLRHPESFSTAAVKRCEERMARYDEARGH